MPEEFEEQEVVETQEEPVDSEVEAKEEQRVPVSVVKELRDELRQAREDSNLSRAQLTQLMGEYQKMVNGQRNKMEEIQEQLDPEVQKLLRPYLRPFESELEEVKKSKYQLESELNTLKAERYIQSNIENFSEIRPHLAKFIQSEYTAEEQADLTPKEVVRIAKFVAKQQGIAAASKNVSRATARAESGTTSQRETGSGRVADLSGDKLRDYLRKNGFFD